jgi:hypothetical protein
MTNNTPLVVKQLDEGFFQAVWGILASGMSALAGWLAAHGWGVIGLGLLAIVVTYLATQLSKMILDVARDPRRKKPVEMADDMHKLCVRIFALFHGGWVAHAFGFAAQVGAATGLHFDAFPAVVIGGLMNSGACVAAFHSWKWGWGDTESAKRFRAILRIKSARFARVSEEEIADAATEKQSPAQMAELRTAIEDQE